MGVVSERMIDRINIYQAGLLAMRRAVEDGCETLVAGATVHAVAQRHGVNTSQLFTWRKRFRTESGLPTAVPVAPAFVAVEVAPVLEAPAETGDAAPHSGHTPLTLPVRS